MKMDMSEVVGVRWEQEMSGTFSVINGVKQGAVLSSILFCSYIDELIKNSEETKLAAG